MFPAESKGGGRGVVVQAACREGLGWTFGAKVRTANMPFMLVTLDVSKLSSWLNFLVYCRDEGRACEAG